MKNYKKEWCWTKDMKGNISMEMIIAISLVAMLFIIIGYIFVTKLVVLGGP